jgi:hypothetical protein
VALATPVPSSSDSQLLIQRLRIDAFELHLGQLVEVVSALHAVYLDLGVQSSSLSALPKSNALSPESIRDVGRVTG